jgi:hypothetical protein
MSNTVGENGKILLQIVTSSSKINFQFQSLKERDRLIQIIKNTPKIEVTTSIQARQALLKAHPEWKKIHKELVIGKIISEEEFWSVRKEELFEQIFKNEQKKGTSSKLIADIRPTDGKSSSDIKFTLNSDIIHSIFTQYPGVHRAFQDHVPLKMTEKEFWTQYFSSKYFHRNRVGLKKANQPDDMFEPYMALENGK